jgi:hypothetical protein
VIGHFGQIHLEPHLITVARGSPGEHEMPPAAAELQVEYGFHGTVVLHMLSS